MKDEIIHDVWATKDRIGARYHGNVKKFMTDLRKQQAHSLLRVVKPKFAPKGPKSA
jgi:hypothetical protein